MKPVYLRIAITTSILIAALSSTANSQQTFDTDFQVWNDITITKTLDEKKDWTFSVGGVWRVGNNVRTSADERVSVVLMRKLNKTFSIGTGYVYRASNPTFRRRLYESRYQAIGVVNVPLPEKFHLSSRNILLYQSLYSRPDTSVFRSRFWLKRPVKVGKRSIEPFLAYEHFYDFRADSWVRYRIQPGITTKIYKDLSGDFFFLRQNEGGNGRRPGTLNAVGSSLRINL